MLQRYRLFTVTISILLLFYLHFRFSSLRFSPPPRPNAILPANSTLNFGAIISVSHSRSPRLASLLWAANLTDLDIAIPAQPEWTGADVEEFRSGRESTITKGSAKAWLGHLYALKWFLDTGYETAMIVEDDVDFSLSVRRTQIPLLAAAFRSLFNVSNPASPQDFWGPIGEWDILYPGHCDDLPSPLYRTHPSILYPDPTTPTSASMHPATQHFLSYLNVPPNTRLLHRALYPFCTFAYAVTRQSAARIVQHFSKEKEGGISAFDVQLLEACRDGWRCWSVVPEIFHHGVSMSEISRADGGQNSHLPWRNAGAGQGGKVRGVEEMKGEMVEVEQDRGFDRATYNIECGARSGALWVDEGDEKGREDVRRVVKGYVEEGECPIGRGGEKWWVGCEERECGGQS